MSLNELFQYGSHFPIDKIHKAEPFEVKDSYVHKFS